MKAIARSLVVVLVALIAVPALVVSTALTTAVQLLAFAGAGFYMGGTQHPLSTPPDTAQFITDYMNLADTNYIVPATGVAPTTRIPVVYPAQVAPFSPFLSTSTLDNSVLVGRNNLDSCLRGGPCNDGPEVPRQPTDTFDVYGYSLSAIVAALAKQDLMANPGSAPADTNFFLIANPLRPNGGILARGFEGMTIPLVGITFYGPAPNSCPSADPCTTADTGKPVYDTVDVAQQYDFLGGDAPARLDLIAFANSIAAYAQLHGAVPNQTIPRANEGTIRPTGVVNQGKYGDTTYYLITDPTLPVLLPLETAGVPHAALALPDAILRVWIEDKYVRDQSPGEHVQFQIIPIGNPVALVGNMLGAVPVGIDDTVQGFAGGGTRPLGTADVYRPFGVGGPVYNKTTGAETTDNVGIPTGAGDYVGSPNSSQTLVAPETGDSKLAVVPDASELGNDKDTPKAETPKAETPKAETPKAETPKAETPKAETPKAIKPSLPFEKWREGLKADPSHRPLGIRPGEGPVSRVVKALTGQRSKSASQKPVAHEPEGQDDAA
jgi:PE-PPE domain